jgi:hypothetical protein
MHVNDFSEIFFSILPANRNNSLHQQLKATETVAFLFILEMNSAPHTGQSSVRQAKLGVSDRVKVPIEKGLTNHSDRVLQS